jgi:hypothetical protein
MFHLDVIGSMLILTRTVMQSLLKQDARKKRTVDSSVAFLEFAQHVAIQASVSSSLHPKFNRSSLVRATMLPSSFLKQYHPGASRLRFDSSCVLSRSHLSRIVMNRASGNSLIPSLIYQKSPSQVPSK